MIIKNVCFSDISDWILLSKEYDKYVQETVSNLTEWYNGSDASISFDNYMKSKIRQNEAFMAANENGICCGIIAISKRSNNITFFGVSHKYDLYSTGELLLDYALSQLNTNISIRINEIKSNAEQIQKVYTILNKFDFVYLCDELENGVPVNCMERKADI